ncbi:MAG: hypothetical protein MH321_17670 [Leptospiraceae bacterium]|nr:hypothetical protein [Leptospiraceae bacterium]
MADKAGKLNPDEFSDLEPVLDDDSFAFDFEDDDSLSASNNDELDFGLDPGMEPPDLDEINTLDTSENNDDFDFGTDSLDLGDSNSSEDGDDSEFNMNSDDIGLDSMVSSAGDEYPDDTSSLDLDLDSGLDLIDEELPEEEQLSSKEVKKSNNDFTDEEEEILLDAPDLFNDIEEPQKSSKSIPNISSESENIESEFSLDLEIDDDDPLIDEKIDQIVNEEDDSSPIKFESKESHSEFNFDDLDAEDEPITLSLDELENIVNAPMTKIDEESLDSSPEIDTEFSSLTEDSNSTDKNYTDDELDQILGTDIYEEDEKEAGLLDLGSTDLDIAFDETIDPLSSSKELESSDSSLLDEEDMSDEPIALSMDELQNIMAEGEVGSESENLALDLDLETPPTNVADDIDFTDFEENAEINTEVEGEDLEEVEGSIFSEEELADEPITLSMDELENIATFDDASPNEDSSEYQDLSEEESVFTVDDDAEDEPITLSMDELSNITGDEEVLGSAFDDTLPDTSLDDSEIAWSDEDKSEPELDDEFSDLASGIDLTDDEASADEPITLSIDELSAITSEPEDSADIFSAEDLEDHSSLAQSDKKQDDFGFDEDFSSAFDEEDSSSAELKEESKVESGADLDDFSTLPEPDDSVDFDEFTLEDGDVSSEDVDKLSEPSEEENSDFGFDESSDEEDESITLSDDELGNILGGEDELPAIADFGESVDLTDESNEEVDELDSDFAEAISSDEEEAPNFGIDENEDEPIALTSEELTDIIGDLPPGEDLEDIDSLSFDDNREPVLESNLKASLDPNDLEDESMIDLDEYSVDGGLSPLEEMRSTPSESAEELDTSDLSKDEQSESFKDSQGNELSNEDKKKVLTYLDNLLGNLPDDMIREFSKSNYFDLYKKLMKEIGL